MVKAKMVPHTGDIDLSKWGFNPVWGEDLGKYFSDAIRDAFASDPPELSFPFEWGKDSDGRNGPGVDPLTVYISLPLGEYSDEGPEWSCSLADEVQEIIGLHCNGSRRVVEEAGVAALTGLAAAFRGLADTLEAAIGPVEQTSDIQTDLKTDVKGAENGHAS